MNNKLNLMVGIPGSGKSYWINKHITDKDIKISRDEIRFKFLKDGEAYFSHENEVYLTFIDTIQKAIDSNKYENIFIDATHLNASSRNKLLYNLNLSNVNEINCIYLKTPLEMALERNKTRTGRQFVPESSIRNMYESLKLPEE
ncbi:MAG: AAA family ATPase [Bacilli bacterium]